MTLQRIKHQMSDLFITPQLFGAKGDGTTDDTAAVQAWLTAAIAGGGGYVPPGVYRCTATLTGTVALGKRPTIWGMGEASVLRFPSGVDGLILSVDHNSRTNYGHVTLDGLRFETEGANLGQAIKLNGVRVTGIEARSCVVRDVTMIGAAADGSQGWLGGLWCDDMNAVQVDGGGFFGVSVNPNTKRARAYRISGANSPTEHRLRGLFARSFEYGLLIEGTVEGVSIEEPSLVSGRYGVYHNCVAGLGGEEPLVTISGGHINTYNMGVYAASLLQATITGTLFYQDPGIPTHSGPYAGAWWAIKIDQGDHIVIKGVNIQGAEVLTDRRGIEIQGASIYNQIKDNIIRGRSGGAGPEARPITRGIILGSTTENCEVGGNIFDRVTQRYDIAGTANRIDTPVLSALYRRGANQSVDVGATVAVQWDTLVHDEMTAWSGGNPTRLTVPEGVYKVRLSAQVIWAAMTSATALLEIRKNGATIPGGAFASQDMSVTPNDALRAVTAALVVVPGDYFEVIVSHTDAVSRSVLAGGLTWFSMESVA